MSRLSPAGLQWQMKNINDDRRAAVIAAIVVCATVSYIFVGLRLLAHRKSATSLRPDDWAILASLVFATAQYVDLGIGIAWGLGRHVILITNPVSFGKNLISAEIVYISALAAVKVSILLLWGRLFPSKRFRIALWASGGLVVTVAIIAITVVLLQCVPLEHVWRPSIAAKCINRGLATTFLGAANILTDLIIILLPIKQLLKLRLRKRDRLQLIGLFLTGGFVLIVSAARLFFTERMNDEDATWTYVDAGVWSSAEVCAAIVSACLPTLRPLFGKRRMGATISYPSIRLRGGPGVEKLDDGADTFPMETKDKQSVQVKVTPSWRDVA